MELNWETDKYSIEWKGEKILMVGVRVMDANRIDDMNVEWEF